MSEERGPLRRTIGPIAAGLLLDLVDLASFGPVGVVPGLAIGGGLGWVLSGVYGYSSSVRPIIAIAAAKLYGRLPGSIASDPNRAPPPAGPTAPGSSPPTPEV